MVASTSWVNNSSLTQHKTRRAWLKNRRICYYCGGRATIDHIIPCHVFDLTMEFEEDYRDAIRDKSNWRPACKSCNSKRLAAFTPNEVPTRLRLKYSSNINKYVQLRHEILKRQDFKCGRCGKTLTDNETVIFFKRKYHGYDLNAENMMAFCVKCDSKGEKEAKDENTNKADS